MNESDRKFLFKHARDYACPHVDRSRAERYAMWYMDEYASDPEATMEDMPDHPFAWQKFLKAGKIDASI